MATWGITLFVLGLIALVVNLFNIFPWFTTWWAVFIMVLAFGMLAQVGEREREGEKEKLTERIAELEALLKF